MMTIPTACELTLNVYYNNVVNTLHTGYYRDEYYIL